MSPIHLIKTLVVVVVLGYLVIGDEAEARSLTPQEAEHFQNQLTDPNAIRFLEAQRAQESADGDDDDDDDDRADLQLQSPLTAAGSSLYQDQPLYHHQLAGQAQQNYASQAIPSQTDLKTSASYHKHHGHGVKGWLDMGAWTGKKGAFGWHDKHPVGGKGK